MEILLDLNSINKNTIIKTDTYEYDLYAIKRLLTKLHKNVDITKINIVVDNNVLKYTLKDDLDNIKTFTVKPPNVKYKSKLSYYCADLNLCIIPVNKVSYIIKNGCNRNKPIRPLFMTREKAF